MQNRLVLSYEDFAPYFKVDGGNLVAIKKSKYRKVGDVIGSATTNGYLTFYHKKASYLVHRVIYFLTHGNCPRLIDHINGNKLDNRPENLRPCEESTNHFNSVIQSNNTTGFKGVHKLKDGLGYQAYINYNKKRKFLGTFKTVEDADEFVSLAREMAHGEFANHGVRI